MQVPMRDAMSALMPTTVTTTTTLISVTTARHTAPTAFYGYTHQRPTDATGQAAYVGWFPN
jgi:hypothetical protein